MPRSWRWQPRSLVSVILLILILIYVRSFILSLLLSLQITFSIIQLKVIIITKSLISYFCALLFGFSLVRFGRFFSKKKLLLVSDLWWFDNTVWYNNIHFTFYTPYKIKYIFNKKKQINNKNNIKVHHYTKYFKNQTILLNI